MSDTGSLDDLIPDDHPATAKPSALDDLLPEDHPGSPKSMQQELSREQPFDDIKLAAPASAIARASLAPNPQTQILRYAEHFKQPVEDFTMHGDKIIRKVPETGTYAYVEPSMGAQKGFVDKAHAAGDLAASGAGQAIPTIAGAAGTLAGGVAAGAPGAIGTGAALGAAGEGIREALDKRMAGDEQTPMDLGNIAAWGAAGAANKPLEAGAARLAGPLKRLIAKIPGFEGLVKTVPGQGAQEIGTNALGLNEEATDAVREHVQAKIADVHQTLADAKELGIDLSVGQATGSPTLMRAERQQARYPMGTEAFGARRQLQNDVQVPGAVRSVMGEISPAAGREEAIGGFREGADATINAEKTKRSEASAPIYNEAFKANKDISSPYINRVLQTPEGQDALKYAISRMRNKMLRPGTPDPELTEAYNEAVAYGSMDPGSSPGGVAKGFKLQTLDFVKQGLYDAEQAAKKGAANGTAREGLAGDIATLRRNFTSELDRQDVTAKAGPNSMKADGGLYAKARSTWGDASEAVDDMLNGGLGYIQRLSGPDRQSMVNRVFSGQNLLPEEVGRMRGQFATAGKLDDWNKGVRSYIQDKLFDAMQPTQGGEASNVGGKLYQSLWGNPDQADVLKAAIGDQGKVARWETLGKVLKAAAHQLPEGSPTVTDATAQGVPGAMGKMLKLASAKLHPAGAAADALANYIEKVQSPAERKKVVDFMLTTDGDKMLRALQSTVGTAVNPTVTQLTRPQSQQALRAFLTAAGVAVGAAGSPHGGEGSE